MEAPQYHQLKGSGNFSAPTGSFSSEFLLLRNPYWMGVLATMEDQIEAYSQFVSNSGGWKLSGTLQDGRTVQSDSLLNTGLIEPPYNVGFSILESVSIGKGGKDLPVRSDFPLVNCFEGDISMRHRDWEISMSAEPSVNHKQILSRQWKMPCEGVTLHCSCYGKKPADHLDIARSIMTLASLAMGTGVSSHRYILHWPSSELETWRFMSGDELGTGLYELHCRVRVLVALDRLQAFVDRHSKLMRIPLIADGGCANPRPIQDDCPKSHLDHWRDNPVSNP